MSRKPYPPIPPSDPRKTEVDRLLAPPNRNTDFSMDSSNRSAQSNNIDRSIVSSEGDYSSDNSLPPPPPQQPLSQSKTTKISSLDFERVVNEFSIQAAMDRLFLDGPDDTDTASRSQGYPEEYGTARQQIPESSSTKSLSALRQSASKGPVRPRKLSTGRSTTRWALSATVGLFTGLTTILIVETTGTIVHYRTSTLDLMAQSDRYPNWLVFIGFSIFNLCLALSASMLCVYIAPEGTGSGIPEVKAYLNGVRVKKFSDWKLFVVKILGTILSVSSSLAVGMEGPLIHIGAIIGASFTKMATPLSRLVTKPSCTAPTGQTPPSPSIPQRIVGPWLQPLWMFVTSNLSYFSVDAERRDLISIGASVGFAASFGAPIGGLLFILDDISSYFSKNMFLRTLVANAIGTFCLAIQSGNLSNYSIINLGTYQGAGPKDDIFLNRFEFVPLYMVVGVVGGALGGIFCLSFKFIKVYVNDRLSSNFAKLTEVAILSLVTSALTFGLPIMAWVCQPINFDESSEDIRGRQFFCGEGEVNEMATIMFGSRDDAIKRILSSPHDFQQNTLWTVGILFYGLMTLTYGSILPSGIFTPTVLIGASLGGAAGLALEDIIGPDIIPATFALLGVAAMLAGIQRSTVSISVILVEGTGQIKVLLPVIIVVLVARYVAEWFHQDGLYELAMSMKKYPYLDHEEKRKYDIFEVSEIMSSPPDTIGPMEKASNLVRMLQKTSHNGYPVVDPKSKKFLGLVRRDQIVALLECGVFEDGDFDPSDGLRETNRSDHSNHSISSPRVPGISKSPLMHWAYHIKDDRYDYVKCSVREPVQMRFDSDDDFDRHEWLKNVRQTVMSMRGELAGELQDTQLSTAGDDSMPSLQHILASSKPFGRELQPQVDMPIKRATVMPSNATPEGFAEVGVNEVGNLIVTWLNPDYRSHYVNLAAVMNRGTYCIPEFLPVSKARFLFTRLGLRHVVVLGGDSGGEVTGIFTRANLMPESIEKRTGITI